MAGTVVTTFIRFAKQRSFVSLISSLSSRFSLRFSLLCLCFTLFFLLDIQLSLSHSHILSVLFLFSPPYCYSFSPASVEFSHCFTSRTTKKKNKGDLADFGYSGKCVSTSYDKLTALFPLHKRSVTKLLNSETQIFSAVLFRK